MILMSYTMRLYERLIYHKLRHETTVVENHFGFVRWRSVMEVIFLLKPLMKKYREKKVTYIWCLLTQKKYTMGFLEK